MCSIKINIIYFISYFIIVQVEALDPLPIVEDNNIAITETVIRNTLNSLFAPFKIKGIKTKPHIQQYSQLHNYFVSITLKDCENLKKIARLSTVNNIDNGTKNYITQINEVLNEGDKNDHVTTYIEKFITKLRYLKDKYVFENNTHINKSILKILEENRKPVNNTVYNGTDDQSENNNILDDNEFWQMSGRRIFEGIRTKIKYFPFMASVHFFNTFQCAGSIIRDDLVITSASCLQIAWNNRFFRENPAFLAVRVGSNMYRIGGDFIPVVEIFFHPQYNPNILAHNLAIMRLERVLKFQKNRKSIKKINFDRNPFPLDSTAQITVVGWGARDISNVIYDVEYNRLSFADMYFYPLPECQDRYSKTYVTERNFCAGFFSKGGGACNHDAGGPGISNNKLIGVISFGSPVCGATDAPTVFTKLGYYVDWIDSILEKDKLVVKGGTTTWSPIPSRIPLPATIKYTTKLIIHPIGPDVRFEDMLRARASKENFSEDFVSTTINSDSGDSFEQNMKYVRETLLPTEKNKQKTTEEWFIKSTVPITAPPEPFLNYEDHSEVSKLNIADEEITTELPIVLLAENQNDNNEEPKTSITNNEVSTDVTATPFLNTNPTNSNNEERNLLDDIMLLIDNLDIDSLFNNVPVLQNDNIQEKEIPNKDNELDAIVQDKKNEANSSENLLGFLVQSSGGESSNGDDDDGDNSDSADEDENDNRGMDIQAEPFQDLTFREVTNA